MDSQRKNAMTAKLFVALYAGLIVGMIVLFVVNFEVAWVFFGFLFVTVFGGIMVMDRPYLIAAAFLLASLIVLGVGLYAMQQSIRVNGWPTATGAITRAWVCTRWVNGEVVYTGPCIDYTYTANEQVYQVSSVDTREFSDRGLWWAVTGIPDQYRVDRAVKVYYDPANPGVSRLDPAIRVRDWITTMIGGAMAALSAFTLWWVVFKRTPNDAFLADLKTGQAINTFPRLKSRRSSRAQTIPDIGDQLEKLAQLHEKGSITDEEYDLAKKKLLGS
jgi:hypothetical protein